MATDDKSNQITAIPKLLELLDIKNAVVSIDAMGGQKEIARQIKNQGGDYLLGVKGNQKALYNKTRILLKDIELEPVKGLNPDQYDDCEKTESGHGREETRRVWVSTDVKSLGKKILADCPGIRSLIMVENQRQVMSDPKGKITIQRRIFIRSRAGPSAENAAKYVCRHWSVENPLHWRLDRCYGEDDSRIRKNHGAENFARLRRFAMNTLKSDPANLSLKAKRYRWSLDREYLLKMMQQ